MSPASRAFEVLDHRSTELGDLVLRRRGVISLDGHVVWEVMLDGRLLMSSLVNDSERALAQLALEAGSGAGRANRECGRVRGPGARSGVLGWR